MSINGYLIKPTAKNRKDNMTELRFIVQAVQSVVKIDDMPLTHKELFDIIGKAYELKQRSTQCTCKHCN